MTRTLRISPDFELPLDLVTHRNAILAMSGAGKSNLAVVLAEEMSAAGVPWIAIDPKGDWHGVRSNRAGDGPGLSVPILGGEHGDLPLSPHAGTLMAELVAEGKLAGVFDVSDFATKGDLSRFLTDFAQTLLHRQRTPLHLFLEECDEYLPQAGSGGRLDPQAAICVGAWKRLAKRGRFRGLGYTLISQRAAAVNKDALYQCETLIAMRVMGKRDKEAVRGWVEQHEGSDDLLKSLPSLQDGEAWIWSPQRLKVMQRVRARRRNTFDSGRTPVIGEALVVPTLAPVDIAALRERIEATRGPRAGAEDDEQEVATLREVVARLERELEAKPTTIEVRVADPRIVSALQAVAPAFHAALEHLRTAGDALNDALGFASERPAAALQQSVTTKVVKPTTAVQKRQPVHETVAPQRVHPQTSTVPRAKTTSTPPEGWTMEEDELYQKFKSRLMTELRTEAPAILKTLATAPELEVTVERKVVEITDATLKGRLARMIAEDWFNDTKTGNAAFVELQRTGFSTAKPNVYKQLDELTSLGILTKETDGYRIAPGAKVRLKKAE